MVWCLGYYESRVSGCGVWDMEFGVQVQDLGFRV
jgi:hypothetical protein